MHFVTIKKWICLLHNLTLLKVYRGCPFIPLSQVDFCLKKISIILKALEITYISRGPRLSLSHTMIIVYKCTRWRDEEDIFSTCDQQDLYLCCTPEAIHERRHTKVKGYIVTQYMELLTGCSLVLLLKLLPWKMLLATTLLRSCFLNYNWICDW